MVAAAPARHDQNSFAVRQIKKFLGLELAFQTDGIQTHVADVAELVGEPL